MPSIDWSQLDAHDAGQPAPGGAIDWNAVTSAVSANPPQLPPAAPARAPLLFDAPNVNWGDVGRMVGANAGNMLAGAVRGAGSIGATLVAPYDMAKDALAGKGASLESNRQRRADMDGASQSLGADPQSLQYNSGKLGAEVLGTLGVGPAIAIPLKAGAAAVPWLAPFLAPVANAVKSGGFSVGRDMSIPASVLTRAAGGAINGGAAAGLVDPEQAKNGAMIGAVLPVGTQAVGRTVQTAVNAFKTPQELKVAQQLAAQFGLTPEGISGALTGPQMIPGYVPTLPQMLLDPAASQLQRTLQTAGQQAIADAGKSQQSQFRAALSQIAPLGGTVPDAANRAGSAIQDFAIPARQAAKENVSALFQAVPDAEATMQLPLSQMQDAQTRFVGPGTFGKGVGAVEQAMQAATNIGTDPLTPLTQRAVPFSQIQALRSSIGEAITGAQANGQNQAAAALTAMKNSIDNKVADVAAGNALPGEVFTPEAIDQWGQALNAHRAMQQQFGVGPQAAMFRMGADGQPAIQGAEIPSKFFNGNMSQVEDAQAFKRLIGNRDDLAREMKSFALTQGVDNATQNGNLAQSFIDWAKSRSGAVRELFTPQEQATIGEVSKAVERQIAAENLGRVSGPDTAQKLASLQSNGMLDNKVVDAFARKVPLIGHFTGPMLDGLRMTAGKARGQIQAGLMADPMLLAQVLARQKGLANYEPAALGVLSRGIYPSLADRP